LAGGHLLLGVDAVAEDDLRLAVILCHEDQQAVVALGRAELPAVEQVGGEGPVRPAFGRGDHHHHHVGAGRLPHARGELLEPLDVVCGKDANGIDDRRGRAWAVGRRGTRRSRETAGRGRKAHEHRKHAAGMRVSHVSFERFAGRAGPRRRRSPVTATRPIATAIITTPEGSGTEAMAPVVASESPNTTPVGT